MHKIHISRRKAIGLAGAAVAAPYISRGARAAGKELVFCSWGGSYQKILRKAFLDPFEKETGIKVTDTSAPVVAQVKAQVDAKNVEWDVIEGGTRWYPVLLKQGLIQPLDLKADDGKGLLPGAVVSHGAAPLMVSFVLAYNTDHFKDAAPASWADFWDVQKFPGARSLGADVTYNLEFALLADGVPVDKLYPIDADRAFAKLQKIREHIKVWWKQGDQPTQLLSSGEVVMSSAWCGRTVAAHKTGLPLNLSWGQGAYSPSFYMIPTGAPHRDEAVEFIKFAMRAKPQADAAAEVLYGPTNPAALPMLAADLQKQMPTYPANMKLEWPLQGDWLADNFDTVNDRWQKFLLGA